MKKLLFVALFSFALSTQAAPKLRAEGIYVGDSTISHAPPRTTFALIEPNGELWSTALFSGGVMSSGIVHTYSGVQHVIYGKINTKSGDGWGTEFVPVNLQLKISTTIAENAVKFLFSEDEPGYPISSRHHTLHPQGKRSAYDVVLTRQDSSVDIPDGVYNAEGAFSMTVQNNKLSGSLNNCIFNGSLKDVPLFQRVDLTLRNDCFAPDGITPLKRGTKLEGVIFSAEHSIGTSLFVLIVKAKTGSKYIAFAKFFAR